MLAPRRYFYGITNMDTNTTSVGYENVGPYDDGLGFSYLIFSPRKCHGGGMNDIEPDMRLISIKNHAHVDDHSERAQSLITEYVTSDVIAQYKHIYVLIGCGYSLREYLYGKHVSGTHWRTSWHEYSNGELRTLRVTG